MHKIFNWLIKEFVRISSHFQKTSTILQEPQRSPYRRERSPLPEVRMLAKTKDFLLQKRVAENTRKNLPQQLKELDRLGQNPDDEQYKKLNRRMIVDVAIQKLLKPYDDNDLVTAINYARGLPDDRIVDDILRNISDTSGGKSSEIVKLAKTVLDYRVGRYANVKSKFELH